MPVTDTPQTQCPKCGAWLDDHDGFGVLAHGKCGYCSHPSSLDGVCGICGKLRETDRFNPATIALEKGDTVAYSEGHHVVLDVTPPQFVKIDWKGGPRWIARSECKFLQRTAVYDAFRAMK